MKQFQGTNDDRNPQGTTSAQPAEQSPRKEGVKGKQNGKKGRSDKLAQAARPSK